MLPSKILTLQTEQPLFKKTDFGYVSTLKEKNRKRTVYRPEVLFVTSLPPRVCGIATYSHDLVHALSNQFKNTFDYSFCALETENDSNHYDKPPKFILNTESADEYLITTLKINEHKNIELVVIQHEFGFFHSCESSFETFYKAILAPKIFVFHTVLPSPDADLKMKMVNMAQAAVSIIVMTKNAAGILNKHYGIEKNKITVIQHGTHLSVKKNPIDLKLKYNLGDRKILSSFGFIGASKSIETTLNALPKIIEMHPDVLFLILGRTHPNTLKKESEHYREMLEKKVHDLGLKANVRFVNEYLSLPILLDYLQLTDIYLFTSKDKNQAVSGTFSYAISSGCPIISTPIPHAQEVLTEKNGIIIDFENENQLAEAVITLLHDTDLRNELASNSSHKMAATSWQNSAIAHVKHFGKFISFNTQIKFNAPEVNLEHVHNMTKEFGILQFSKIDQPDLSSGYTLDDNARALIALCQKYALRQHEEDLKLIYTYFNVIKTCIQSDGSFLNYLNEKIEFTDQNYSENLEDSNGRAIWALGYISSQKKILPISITSEAEYLIQVALPKLLNIHSTRAMAFIIKGLYENNHADHLETIQVLAKRLVQMYKHEKSANWLWFENSLTYGNSVIPEALLCAYLATHDSEYKRVAIESFDFLLTKLFSKNQLRLISNQGWHLKEQYKISAPGGEQPIDAAYTVMALERFYNVTRNEEYKQKAQLSFSWFLGNNHLSQTVYNPVTGGCYDGLEAYNVNLNQGAESTISYLLARLAYQRMNAVSNYCKPKSGMLVQPRMKN